MPISRRSVATACLIRKRIPTGHCTGRDRKDSEGGQRGGADNSRCYLTARSMVYYMYERSETLGGRVNVRARSPSPPRKTGYVSRLGEDGY